ncbi:MAG: hypothetical protein M1827_003963 [Pycnora praestabilis]|nr:MAG: hypothetical protein M1827_003963 [Pycnora praestabilis]
MFEARHLRVDESLEPGAAGRTTISYHFVAKAAKGPTAWTTALNIPTSVLKKEHGPKHGGNKLLEIFLLQRLRELYPRKRSARIHNARLSSIHSGILGPSTGGRFDTQAQTEKARVALSKLRAWGKEKQSAVLPKPKASSNAARIVALNQLKKTAKGDEKIPVEKRVYLHVEAEAQTTTSKFPKGEFYYNKEWSIGRVLDAAAKDLQVQNINNRGGGEKEKLRVFHVEGGRLLEFSEKTGEATVNGNTVVLLRGIGPAVPDLIAV